MSIPRLSWTFSLDPLKTLSSASYTDLLNNQSRPQSNILPLHIEKKKAHLSLLFPNRKLSIYAYSSYSYPCFQIRFRHLLFRKSESAVFAFSQEELIDMTTILAYSFVISCFGFMELLLICPFGLLLRNQWKMSTWLRPSFSRRSNLGHSFHRFLKNLAIFDSQRCWGI